MLLPLLLLGGSLVSVSAESVFWIVQLDPLATTRLDPIISPGEVSMHVHSFVGASGLAPVHDYDRLQDSQCTTASVGSDKSNYWVPQLYRKSGNNSLTLAPLHYVNVYYQLRRQPEEPVYEFPPGFRMVAGNPARTTYDPTDNRQAAINYNCLNFNGGGGPETNGFPDRQCPNDLRAQVRFPSCWDGEHAWLPGGAHMAYGAGAHDGGGKCPDSHPYRTMSLFYEFHYKDDYPYEAGARVWATGDTTGYSFHGDFANGWPEGLFTEVWAQGDTCDVFFRPQDCPPLGRTAPNPGKSSCRYGGVTVDEDIGRGGSLAALPGNNPLYGTSGPNRPTGYTESAQLVDGSGAAVQPQQPYNGAMKASVRRRGIVRGDPGTPAVEQLEGGGETTVVAPSSSAAAAVSGAASSTSAAAASASASAVSTGAGAVRPASSAVVSASSSTSAASAVTSRPAGTGNGNGNDGSGGNGGGNNAGTDVSLVLTSTSEAAATTSVTPTGSGHKGCKRSRVRL